LIGGNNCKRKIVCKIPETVRKSPPISIVFAIVISWN